MFLLPTVACFVKGSDLILLFIKSTIKNDVYLLSLKICGCWQPKAIMWMYLFKKPTT